MSDENVTNAATGVEPAKVGTWRLDSINTSINLGTRAMWGVVKVKGTLKATEGTAIVADDGTITGSLVIDASSIDTNNKKRDDHLKSSDFFAVDKYPSFVYSIHAATKVQGDHFKLTGNLTVLGTSKPVNLEATIKFDPSGERASITAKTNIDRSVWGMSWSKMGAALHNELTIKAEFVKG